MSSSLGIILPKIWKFIKIHGSSHHQPARNGFNISCLEPMILPYISSSFGEMTPVLYTSELMVLVDDRLLGAVPIRSGLIYI
jgi:hypothetical protein